MSRANALSNHPAASFTIRRPSPLSRNTSESDSSSSTFRRPPPLSNKSAPSPLASSVNSNGKRPSRTQNLRDDYDSSDDEPGTEDEIITGFDAMGVQRATPVEPKGPLVIPALSNRDWRAASRKRQALSFVPDSAKAATGADGSVGGLGTRDSINSGPQLAGLITKSSRSTPIATAAPGLKVEEDVEMEPAPKIEEEDLTEDQRALRAILHGDDEPAPPDLTIPIAPRPADETDAYRQDIVTRPDTPTMDDYDRIPVEQFGAALLRGMGWKEGMAASRTRDGPKEAYLPSSRPALLGLGAKERIVEDVPSKTGGSKKSTRPEKRYVPIIKKGRELEDSRQSSATSSRRASPSPSPPRHSSSDRHREHSRSSRRDDDRDSRRSSSHRDDKDGYRSSSSRRDKDDDRHRSSRDRDRDYERKDDYRSSDRGDKQRSSRSERSDRDEKREREKGYR